MGNRTLAPLPAHFLLIGAVLALTTLGAGSAQALTLEAPFDDDYTVFDLGSVPGLPAPYGGLTLKLGDPNTLLIGGAANSAAGKLYSIGVTRDGGGHITGFSGVATVFADAAYNDGGIDYGPGDVLFLARWPVNEMGQTKPGSVVTDKIIEMAAFGVTASGAGGLTFVPAGFSSAGELKLVSWPSGDFYTVDISPDGGGTFNVDAVTLETSIVGGPEGFVYIDSSNAEFAVDSLLVSEFSSGIVAAYEIDANGIPIVATRRDFITGLTGAEGAFIDPLTGDFFFSTFGASAGDRVISVRGFVTPPIPEPATVGLFGLGLLGIAWLRRRRADR